MRAGGQGERASAWVRGACGRRLEQRVPAIRQVARVGGRVRVHAREHRLRLRRLVRDVAKHVFRPQPREEDLVRVRVRVRVGVGVRVRVRDTFGAGFGFGVGWLSLMPPHATGIAAGVDELRGVYATEHSSPPMRTPKVAAARGSSKVTSTSLVRATPAPSPSCFSSWLGLELP